ncbi:MAG: IclR family transcriptional regulator [Chloroflexi bacterium]|nr:IclR family transcriptional regulator [Chloroflexota bacterium]
MSASSSVKTVDRLVQVLDCFSPTQPTWSLAELSLYLELPKSTLHRFLTGLQIHGILRRDPNDKRWRLGYRLVAWGEMASESTDLRHVARPIMRDLVDTTGETVVLTIHQNQKVVCIEKVETSHSVRLTLEVGIRRPLHAGASSKILMAYLPQDQVRTIIRDQGLPAVCTNTITDPDKLMAELARIRERGYSESLEETDVGAWGVATPIHDRNGNVLAAIGIVGPSLRFTKELAQQYVTLCRSAAQQISTLLGGEQDVDR